MFHLVNQIIPQTISIVVVAAGLLYLSKLNTTLTDTAQLPKSSVLFLVVVSGVALVISFLGCCGAVRESPCLLSSFAGLILILLLGELVVAALLSGVNFDDLASNGLMTALKHRNDTAHYNAIDDIQIQLHCCGVKSIADYPDPANLPYSCCPESDPAVHETCPPQKAYPETCMTALRNELKPAVYTVATAGIIVALIQLAAVIGSCCLARAFRREYDVV
jgi:hypothetical protein